MAVPRRELRSSFFFQVWGSAQVVLYGTSRNKLSANHSRHVMAIRPISTSDPVPNPD